MSTNRDNSFGAKQLRAQELSTYISQFQNYAPPRMEESVGGFMELVNQASMVNTEESQFRQVYNTAVANRENAFRRKEGSVTKLLPLIRGQVMAQYGKNSVEFNQIDAIIANIRDTRVIVKAATETTKEQTMSQSEQSYGSMTQYFANLVGNVAQLPGFNPSNPVLQIGTLQNFVAQITQMNTEVAARLQLLYEVRNRRNAIYADLHDRVLRIKAYVKANYGTNSSEYKLIKGMRI